MVTESIRSRVIAWAILLSGYGSTYGWTSSAKSDDDSGHVHDDPEDQYNEGLDPHHLQGKWPVLVSDGSHAEVAGQQDEVEDDERTCDHEWLLPVFS